MGASFPPIWLTCKLGIQSAFWQALGLTWVPPISCNMLRPARRRGPACPAFPCASRPGCAPCPACLACSVLRPGRRREAPGPVLAARAAVQQPGPAGSPGKGVVPVESGR